MDVKLIENGSEYFYTNSDITEPLFSYEWFTKAGETRVIFGHLFYASIIYTICWKKKIYWTMVGKTKDEAKDTIRTKILPVLGVN